MLISSSFQETTVFLENTKRSTLGICNKQYFLFLYSSSPKGCRSCSGRNGYCKMNCSLQYFHWQFSETVSSSLSNCFWSTKEEHELLKENYFDTAGTVPCLKRLTWKKSKQTTIKRRERKNEKKSNTFATVITSVFLQKNAVTLGRTSGVLQTLCWKKNSLGSAPASTKEKANSWLFKSVMLHILTWIAQSNLPWCTRNWI